MDGSAAPAPNRGQYFPPHGAEKQDVARAPLTRHCEYMFSLQLFI
jgi:hypothetical protein